VPALSLEHLVDTARSLPGERRPAAPRRLFAVTTELDGATVDVRLLRRQLGRLLDELAKRLDPALRDALAHAAVAWDAFDEVSILDADLRADARFIANAAAALERETDAVRAAIGLEVRLALESALGLVHLVERRLATLVRLRVQSRERSLLPDERPFLDVAAALAEAARGWA